MVLTATLYVFGVSLIAIVLLFAFKAFEFSRATGTRAAWRDSADEFALRVKWVMLVIEWYIAHTPQFLTLLARWVVHMSALWFAGLANGLAHHAHRLADFVSHKRTFERRETRNQFLKHVSERDGTLGRAIPNQSARENTASAAALTEPAMAPKEEFVVQPAAAEEVPTPTPVGESGHKKNRKRRRT